MKHFLLFVISFFSFFYACAMHNQEINNVIRRVKLKSQHNVQVQINDSQKIIWQGLELTFEEYERAYLEPVVYAQAIGKAQDSLMCNDQTYSAYLANLKQRWDFKFPQPTPVEKEQDMLVYNLELYERRYLQDLIDLSDTYQDLPEIEYINRVSGLQ